MPSSFNKIPGSALCGFADLFEEPRALIGAAPKKKALPGAPPNKKALPAGKKPLPPDAYKKAAGIKPSATVAQHGKVLSTARKTAARAFATLKGAAKVLVRPMPTLTKSGGKAPFARPGKQLALPARGQASVRGDDGDDYSVYGDGEDDADYTVMGNFIVLGAGPATKVKPLTPKAKAAVAKLDAAKKKSKAAGEKLKKVALKTKTSIADLGKKVKSQRAVARGVRKGPTAIHGLADHQQDAVIGHYEAVGAYPDPRMPGLLTDGSIDPVFAIGDDPFLDPSLDPSGDPGYDPSTDPGFDPSLDAGSLDLEDNAGDPAGLDTGGMLSPEDLATLGPAPAMNVFVADYKKVGGIPYDFAKGKPPGFIISYNLSDPTNPTSGGVVTGQQRGYLFGGRKDVAGWPGEASDHWINVHGQRGLRDWWDDMGGWEVTASVAQRSMSENCGPLVGNPIMPDFKSMRVDGNGIPFYYPQEAPDYLTAPLKQAAQLTKIAAEKAAKAAQEAAAAAIEKTRIDAEVAKAAQDAQIALAESAAASDLNVADTGAAAETARTETAQLKLDVAERQAVLDQQRAEHQQMMQEQQQYAPAPRTGLTQRQNAEPQYEEEPTYEEPQPQYEEPQQAAPQYEEGAQEGAGDPEPASAEEVAEADEVLGRFMADDEEEGSLIGADGSVIAFDDWGNPV